MLIGISGKIGVGKTTLANEICKLSGFTRTAFGDVLKREVSERFGFDSQLCYSATGKEAVVFHPAPLLLRDRPTLKAVGTLWVLLGLSSTRVLRAARFPHFFWHFFDGHLAYGRA